MQFTTLTLTAGIFSMATAAALPDAQPAPNPDHVILAVDSQQQGGDLQGNGWGAMHNGIFTGKSPQEGAVCDGGLSQKFAIFVLNKTEGGTLSLYTNGNPSQELYVDRSGLGQGMMQYTTGAQSAPRNAERQGWAIDEKGLLSFGGCNKFLACPGNSPNVFRVLPDVGNPNPAGYTNCTEITALTKIYNLDPKAASPIHPVKCSYSTS